MHFFWVSFVAGFAGWIFFSAPYFSSADGPIDSQELTSLAPEAEATPVARDIAAADDDVSAYVWTAEEAQDYTEFVEATEKKLLVHKTLPSPDFAVSEEQISAIEVSGLSDEDFHMATNFETADSCLPERNYLNDQVSNIPNVFKLKRKKSDDAATLPQSCVNFVLKKFYEPALTAPKRMFAYCKADSGRPVEDELSRAEWQPKIDELKAQFEAANEEKKTELAAKIRSLEYNVKHVHQMQPCVTEDYATSIYNAFIDVTSCLNIPQKELLPKFFNESGMHMNAFGAGKDAGVGQLTGQAIVPTIDKLTRYVEEMRGSGKPACKRVLDVISSYEKIDPDFMNRCNLMAAPENPLRNLVYTAIFYKDSVRQVTGITYRAGIDVVVRQDKSEKALKNTDDEELGGSLEAVDVRAKFAQLGMPNVNLHRLKTMVVSLGYNSGTVTALRALNAFLNERIEYKMNPKTPAKEKAKMNLTEKDFDFDSIDVAPVRSMIMPKTAKKDATEDEIKAVAKVEAARQANVYDNYKSAFKRTFPEFLTLRTNAGAQEDADCKGIKNSKKCLNGQLRVGSENTSKRAKYELYGWPGYLTALATKANILNANFKKHECTPAGYLSLRK